MWGLARISILVWASALSQPAAAESRTEFPPDWIIKCQGDTVNEVGRAPPMQCSLMKYDLTPIVVIDKSGVKVLGGFQDSLCSSLHDGIGVDRKPIETLPVKRQIEALRGGRVFARETSGFFPRCRPRIEETSLEGFGPAYLQLRGAWKAFASQAR